MCAATAGRYTQPSELPIDESWIATHVPNTAAGALRAAGQLDFGAPVRRFDAEDWWWRTSVSVADAAGTTARLSFDGLATLADVWWNDELVLSSDDMFVAYSAPVALRPKNELVIRCRALDPVLAQKRPRPRWRTPMASHQQLRWIRTTLLGRTPGWSPPVPPVGPWRAVWLELDTALAVEDVRLAPHVVGTSGRLDVSCTVRSVDRRHEGVTLVLHRSGTEHRGELTSTGDGRWAGFVDVANVALWWPHTHGEPCLYAAHLELEGVRVELGAVGFRSIALDTQGGAFALSVNGTPVFCRGACWTPLDAVTLAASRTDYERAFELAVDAGMNMLRISGPMVYEADDFYDLADERGVLVWQDFMFANMDYPTDPAWVETVRTEVRQLLLRLAGRPSVAVLCGNSEGEQQAAMWGAPRSTWGQPLFDEVLPAIANEICPGVPYWPSSAHGGAFPHESARGTTSYYGVGAYLRPLSDARRSGVRFATECLAFANIPDNAALGGGPGARVHHPAWKARTPRDLGAGWDFDDVRDHYVQVLYGVDPLALRYADHDRYVALGRAATGEAMAATFAEWRGARSTCRGALVLFFRDLWDGAGWGVVDARGTPKAAYHYLRRALQPTALFLSDEGLNGLVAHVVNDGPEAFVAELTVSMFRHFEEPLRGASGRVEVPAHGALEVPLAALFDHWTDLTYAHRFGSPTCDLVVARLDRETAENEHRGLPQEAFHFVRQLPSERVRDLGLTASAVVTATGADLTLSTRAFAQSVAITAEGFEPEDDWFHLAPGQTRMVRLRRKGEGAGLHGFVQALDAEAETPIRVAP